jgi:cellulose synthase/poly-beta-1,6-N-acetylglucosamine synthase-like glycosyltransferase
MSSLTSVVITAHNAANTLPRVLASLAAQRGERPVTQTTEVVVVDDRSDDGTTTVAQTSWSGYLTVVRVAVAPQGDFTARQAALDIGLEESRGNPIIVLDADAEVPPDLVARLTGALADADVACAGVSYTPCSSALSHVVMARLQTADAAFYQLVCAGLSEVGVASGMMFGAAAFTRQAARAVGGFRSAGLTLIEDYTFARRVQARGGQLRFIPGAPVRVTGARTFGEIVRRAVRTGTTGGPSALAAVLALWTLSWIVPAVGAFVAGGPWWIVFALRWLAGAGLVASGLFRLRVYEGLWASLCYEPVAIVTGLATAWRVFRDPHVEWGGLRYPRRRAHAA